jgi:hypothetical protein
MTDPPFLLPTMRRRLAKDLIIEWDYACGDGARERNFRIRVSAN